ncbi:MAG: hypothetical protein K2Q13_03935 [Nitrosomonas sp.]|uniref:hypothetical protein n=1 Tax=Nitrosomonas sp. TaxID=42353 RepID=UPI0025F63343|nr:hypothetical protein [Nitrosomonas sp.]MBY0474197.1 hypothetical protein [Nitrosomonas sp.]
MKEFNDQTQFGRLMIAANAKYASIETTADLARHMERDHQVLYNWSKRGIPPKEIDGLSDKYDCNPRWLKDKKGEMHLNEPAKLATKRDQEISEITELLKILPDDDFRQVKDVSENLAHYLLNKASADGKK